MNMDANSRIGAVIYFAGLIFAESLRFQYRVQRFRSRSNWHSGNRSDRLWEILVLLAVIAGIWVQPVLYVFTGWLDRFDYTLPSLITALSAFLFIPGLLIRWAAHRALRAQWSHTVETRDGHLLITDGIYAHLRHPIYTSLVIWAITQPFLIHNWLAGAGGMLAVALIWLVRVPREEKMMLELFGDRYRQYIAKTGIFLPKGKPRHP